MKRSITALSLLTAIALLGPSNATAAPLLERDVLPILTKHCMGCHGGLRQEADLDLRTLPSMIAGGESGTAIESEDEAPVGGAPGADGGAGETGAKTQRDEN